MKDEARVFYVQIKKACLPTFWYANHIGKIFSVTESNEYPEDYCLAKLSRLGFIDKSDCEIVKVDYEVSELSEFTG